MQKKHFLAGLCLLVASTLLFAACSPQQANTPASPTIDANVIYTQAAQTVQAGQALTQAAKPPTQAPTATTQATATIDPVIAAAMTATANAVLPGSEGTDTPAGQTGLATATPASNITPVVLPTATKAVVVQPPAATGDKCEWVKNVPADNTQIQKNVSFDAVIRVKNSGTTTWNEKYALRYYAGEKMGAPSDFFVQGEVKPNATYDFVFPMTAPNSTGKKEVLLVIQNPDARNMCFINIPLEIVE